MWSPTVSRRRTSSSNSAVAGASSSMIITSDSALGYGQEFVPSLVRAQEKLNGVTIAGA